jgi:hypothetical protein
MLMKHQRLLDHLMHCTCKEMVKNDFMCLLGPTPKGRGTIVSNKLTLVKIVVSLIIFVFMCSHFLGCSHFFLSPTIWISNLKLFFLYGGDLPSIILQQSHCWKQNAFLLVALSEHLTSTFYSSPIVNIVEWIIVQACKEKGSV